MTYFGFLFYFLVIPLMLMLPLAHWLGRQGQSSSAFEMGRAVWFAIGLHILLAVSYTTPWDNYLVATGVWTYDPALVSGVILGWVPLEEYTFFVLETVLTGVWWWLLARRLIPPAIPRPDRKLRIITPSLLGLVWLGGVYVLLTGWRPGTYLSLILVWALPALAIQLVFGADILWHFRKLIAFSILPLFVYLSAADSLAIATGTWTISPLQSMGILIGNLPVEEALFFLVTVTLICFGLTLTLATASRARMAALVNQIRKPLVA